MNRKRILITGATGVVGTVLGNGLAEDYEITSLDKSYQGGSNSFAADIINLEQIKPFFKNKDAVIHLAADSRGDWKSVPWESVYSNNILGTYNVYEASRAEGVKKIIFASSNHVIGGYELEYRISSVIKGNYDGIRPEQVPKIDHLAPAPGRPDSLYGVSKLFGEGLGYYYSTEYGLSIICLRIGTLKIPDTPRQGGPRKFSTWLSHRDLVQLVKKCIETDQVKFDIFYGVSNNTWKFYDIEHARQVVGYDPQDNAEDHRSS